MKPQRPTVLAMALRHFISEHLPLMRGASSHTICSYRDSFVLLLRFVSTNCKTSVDKLEIDDIDSARVVAFLQHVEVDRGNSASTRNVRLAAIHALFRYIGGRHPERLEHCQRILGIPFKKTSSRAIEYLEYDEINAVLSAIDRKSMDGRRDYALLATMFNTGARVQELVDLRACDLQLIRPFHARLFGKGRKERLCPLWPQTAEILRSMIGEAQIDGKSTEKIFRNHRNEPLTRFGVRYILAKYCDRARTTTPTLVGKRLHPHSMRHSTAIHLLKSGVDLVTISHWLGHVRLNTTNRYTAINLETKRAAIDKAEPVGSASVALHSNPSVLAWLESL